MPGLPSVDTLRGGVEKGKAFVGQKVEKAKAFVSGDTPQVLNRLESMSNKHPIASLQFIESLQTPTKVRGRVEGKAAKITGGLEDNVLEYIKYNPKISREEAAEVILRKDVGGLLQNLSPREFDQLQKMLKTEGPLFTQVDPTDPSKGMKISDVEKLRYEINKQLPEVEKKRKKNLAKIIAALILAATVDTGKQASQEVRT